MPTAVHAKVSQLSKEAQSKKPESKRDKQASSRFYTAGHQHQGGPEPVHDVNVNVFPHSLDSKYQLLRT